MSETPGPTLLQLQEALGGRYVLERELGRGGMGIVYLAHEVALDRPVALKLLPPAVSTNQVRRQRFLREARFAARLTHPHIVPVYSVDEVESFIYFTMAYIEGESLYDVLRRGLLPVARAAAVLREVAWAVAHAHENGVIHRDLKAENILLEKNSGRALVADFGVAQHVTEMDAGDQEYILGTIPYFSPERALSGSADQRSDVFALGVLGYVAVTGNLPFAGRTLPEIVEEHRNRPAPLLTVLGEHMDPTYARAVNRCLERDVEKRMQKAEDLAEALSGDLPVRLRAFVTQLRKIAEPGAGIMVAEGAFLIWGLSAWATKRWTAVAMCGAICATLLGPPLKELLRSVRALLAVGYGRAEILHAVSVDRARRWEERAKKGGRQERSGTGRAARWIALTGAGLFGLCLVGLVSGIDFAEKLLMTPLVIGAVVAVLGGITVMVDDFFTKYVADQGWLIFWRSPAGAWTLRLAGWGLTVRPDLTADRADGADGADGAIAGRQLVGPGSFTKQISVARRFGEAVTRLIG